jgi:hypothetical protein
MPMEFEVRIPKATWVAGAAQNTGLPADLVLGDATRGIGGDPIRGTVGGNARNQVRSITIVSQDNHSWELWAFSKAVRYPANRDNNFFLGRWTFSAASGVQDAGDGTSSWYYYVDGNDIPIRDDDNTGKLHLTLIDRTGALVAGAGHDVVIELRLAPLSQFP